MISDTFSLYFSQLQDPRQTAKISYRLFDVIFLTVCAVIGGAKGWEDIEYCQAHLLWFHQRGILLEGVPVHDTIARIISRLNPEVFRQCFIDWMQTINERTEGELIAIDGKVLRGSYSRQNRQSVICMQWHTEFGHLSRGDMLTS